MEKLTSSDMRLFRTGLKKIIDTQHRVDLLPVCACLFHIDLTCSATVYVDNNNPADVSIIIIKSKTIDEDDLDKMASDKGNEEINVGRWMNNHRSRDDGNFDSFMCWVKDVNETTVSDIRNVLESSNSKEVSLTAIQHDMLRELRAGKDIIATGTLAELKSQAVYFPCPEGYILKPLTLADAKYALSHWKFVADRKLYLHILASTINGMAIGAYHLESNELVSWVFGNWDGALSALGTVQEHRGKGLAKCVIFELAQVHLIKGMAVFAFVQENVPTTPISKSLFRKLGFTLTEEIFCWA